MRGVQCVYLLTIITAIRF